jgi:hypothetical protein
VGVGTYVAAEAYGVAAGEDPAEQPAQALILPYGIYPNMEIESVEDFVQPAPAVEGFTFAWSLEAPDGSAAELVDGTVAIFMADVEGEYVLTLEVTDANGNVGTTEWVVLATTYVGSGYLEGPSSDESQCVDCHEEKVAAWMETGHADMFVRAIDGTLSDHYSANCITCHTTGFNNRPEAVNGGFDDLARDAGWTFPEEMVDGNWDALVAENPELAGMANIQCESCHGPGYLHVWEGTRRDRMINVGLDYGVCAQCHGEDPYHVFPQQWENSSHADKNAQAFWYPIGENRTACVGCHSGAGYIDRVSGVPTDELRTNYQVITCAVCHDPHDASNPNQLRVFDSVLLPDGTEVASAGPAATCMSCHNARTDPVASVEGAVESGSLGTPHHSTAAEQMYALGGYTWGETLPTSGHSGAVDNMCIGCHMAPTPGTDADGNPLPGHNTVGEHSFAVKDADGVENVAVCQQCHDAVNTSFEFEARRDYDGDGVIESNQAEVEGLRTLLEEALLEAGVTVTGGHPPFEFPESGATVDMYGAAYNLEFTLSGGTAVHNMRFAVSLLQLSYEKLTGEPVPGATILPPK